jgi:hypothetical protein
MHFFELRNIQHFIMYLFPAIIAVFLIGTALAYTHFRKKDPEGDKAKVFYRFTGGIEDRYEPIPLVLILIIVGTVIWAFFYILFTGLLEVKI